MNIMNQSLPWYKDWRSWLTIFFLFFVPTFVFGIGTMWAWTGWNRKIKWAITLIYPILLSAALFLLLTMSLIGGMPRQPITGRPSALTQAYDVTRRFDFQLYEENLKKYYQQKERYPDTLSQLYEEGFIKQIRVDPETKQGYLYQPTNNNQSFILEVALSTGERLHAP